MRYINLRLLTYLLLDCFFFGNYHKFLLWQHTEGMVGITAVKWLIALIALINPINFFNRANGD